LLITPLARSHILVKAIVEEFCPRFVPGGVILYTGEAERNVVHVQIEKLARIGVVFDPEVKTPSVVVHRAAKNWLVLIETINGAGPVDDKRRRELKGLFARCKSDLLFVTAFETRRGMLPFFSQIAWESEVWIAETPDHMIHFNGRRILGPYPDALPKES